MPRLSDVLLVKKPGNFAKFTNYMRAPAYKEVLPEALKNEVSGDGLRSRAVPCLQEMSLMLVCFNKHDFQQGQCTKELQTFYDCQKDLEIAAKKKSDEEAKGLFTKSYGKLPSKRVNELLRNFPQPVDRKR